MYKTVLATLQGVCDESVTVFTVLQYVQRGNSLEDRSRYVQEHLPGEEHGYT